MIISGEIEKVVLAEKGFIIVSLKLNKEETRLDLPMEKKYFEHLEIGNTLQVDLEIVALNSITKIIEEFNNKETRAVVEESINPKDVPVTKPKEYLTESMIEKSKQDFFVQNEETLNELQEKVKSTYTLESTDDEIIDELENDLPSTNSLLQARPEKIETLDLEVQEKESEIVKQDQKEKETQESEIIKQDQKEKEPQESEIIKRDQKEEEPQESEIVKRDQKEEEPQESEIVKRDQKEEKPKISEGNAAAFIFGNLDTNFVRSNDDDAEVDFYDK
ncbi:hypothetical protein IGK74_002318 [Enterococcus sp. AZ150]|uniref:hypothetical protein n=1 Tax=Enterococcus sp. AZ150 TaxID=2774866 RepID=UPI003F2853D4